MPDNIVKSPSLSPAREYWLNADFDSTLGGREALLESGDLTYVHEMAWHFLFAAAPGDSMRVHRALPPGFLAYAESKRVGLPGTVLHPGFSPEAEFTPFGWNGQAEALAARYARTPAHPPLDAVRKANSRSFALELEKAMDPRCTGILCDNRTAVMDWLSTRPKGEAWVLKGEHGYAGTGNLRVHGGPPAEEDEERIEAIFTAHGRAVLERWHARIMDMAILFRSTAEGGVEDFRGHTLLNSRDGAFLGVHVGPDGMPPELWSEALRANAVRLAKALAAIGYHGPVGVDAYVRETPQGEGLRPLVDVNARLSMALPAHGLAQRLPERHILWTWSKPRKLRLPEDYASLDEALGADAYDPETRRGILAVSPIRLEDMPKRGPDDALRPRRVGFALIAPDESDLDELRAAYARVLGRGA